MSKVRIPINPKQVGKVGAYSMYVRDGEQIVRQRQNASNYGESASRTLEQQTRRVKWSNLVSIFKTIKFWQPRAYEYLNAGQTDYNKYMSLNANEATVPLTKQEAANGACVIAPVNISQGSLVSPGLQVLSGETILDLVIAVPQGTTLNTVGKFSEIVLANNPAFQAGDAIAFVGLRNWKDVQGIPRASCEYAELVLDTASTDAFPFVQGNFTLSYNASDSAVVCGWNETSQEHIVAQGAIHTRRSTGTLQVSSEKLAMVDTQLLTEYTAEGRLEAAIESYGLSTEVLLVPGGE